MKKLQIHDIARDFVKQALKKGVSTRRDLQLLKNKFSVKYGISHLSSIELLKAYEDLDLVDSVFEKLIRKRGVRSLSGIASVTVMTKDYPCPGKCIFCPTEKDMPKSYLSNEPAVMRAILNDFDPYRQTVSRLKGLMKTGHPTDKIELIISGGTFNFYPPRYQTDFVRGVFNGLNFDAGGVDKRGRGSRQRSLVEAQHVNESAKHRCVGLSLETRPDYVNESELVRFRKLGCTKVEIGVQCLDDEIYKMNKRGHTVSDVRKAMGLLKDAGFKINVHFMPNMYGSSLKKDLSMFKELFDDSDFRPDWLKIYPCVVVPGSKLVKIFEEGGHVPYTDSELIDLLVKFKEIVPEYCRITRLYRDIPAESIVGGSKISNLRQYVQEEMGVRKKKCRCIRCREIKDDEYRDEDVKLVVREYDSSGGREFFVAYEDVANDRLIGYLRLRIPSQYFTGEKHWIGELSGSSIIREIHVFGQQIGLGGRDGAAGQHKGYGKKLIEEAARLTKSVGVPKLAVISGVGVREYYRKLGFEDGGLYQFKKM
ncbi:tRNA uridine(34) 5-carboxymethylaminomethyl modification radical SAM/GNAT enzyme Elp3 [Candidatus Peregrinibacteria bacterium]|nr:tRNA uridine(34) 5-carboxymethylaminomethyl modification radical SAM/GNAT enzyme Elp3 [Candidatus Peregrinibacteria bacterium]MBT4056428.1 tRNA uridine(34) 5-carboxymethylaminomethyl modification radical SAM/GNAT enzyme Elp3 [Candidatus Peregrinibacteria bacterium]